MMKRYTKKTIRIEKEKKKKYRKEKEKGNLIMK